jgi:hypothetical protein
VENGPEKHYLLEGIYRRIKHQSQHANRTQNHLTSCEKRKICFWTSTLGSRRELQIKKSLEAVIEAKTVRKAENTQISLEF